MLRSPHFSQLPLESEWQDSPGMTAVSDPLLSHHEIEQSVWRELHSLPGVNFYSLTVRRVPDGVCLQGVMEVEGAESDFDIGNVVRQIAPVENVVNQLVVHAPSGPSRLPR